MSTYTDDQREEAIAAYLKHGCNQASRDLGIPSTTISRWALQAGAGTSRPENVQAAVDAHMAATRLRLAQLADTATEATLEAVERDGADVKCRDLVGVWTRAIHDYQLLTGQATERMGGDPVKEAERILDELEADRARRQEA